MYDTLVINGETVTEAGPIKANVAIKDGRVAGLLAHGVKPEAAQVIDAQGKLVSGSQAPLSRKRGFPLSSSHPRMLKSGKRLPLGWSTRS